jgi:hypothetical protein
MQTVIHRTDIQAYIIQVYCICVQINRYTNIQGYKCTGAKSTYFTNAQAYKIYGCTNEQVYKIYRCTNEQIDKCTSVQMYRFPSVQVKTQLYRCSAAQWVFRPTNVNTPGERRESSWEAYER